MKTIELKLYKFDELDVNVREKLIQRSMERLAQEEFFWWGGYRDSLQKFVEIFELDWESAGYDYLVDINTRGLQGSNVEHLRGNRLRTWIVNKMDEYLYEHKVYRKDGKKRTSRISKDETCCPFTGYCADYVLLAPFREFVAKRGVSGTSFGFDIENRYDTIDLDDIIIEANCRFNNKLNDDYEHQCSRESAIEIIQMNDHDYTEHGEVYY